MQKQNQKRRNGSEVYNSQKERCEYLYGDKPGDIDLQLLFVVMGDTKTVVKLEATAPEAPRFFGFGDSMGAGDVRMMGRFEDVRAAVDALDEKPPVPRIERVSDEYYRTFTSFHDDKISGGSLTKAFNMSGEDYDALSQLAGKPLPIWEAKKGEWKELVRLGEVYPHGPTMDVDCRIWRYTRRR